MKIRKSKIKHSNKKWSAISGRTFDPYPIDYVEIDGGLDEDMGIQDKALKTWRLE